MKLVEPSPAAVLRADLVASSAAFPDLDRMFALATLKADYERFADRFAPVRGRLRDGTVAPPEALVARTRLMDTWREFADADPDLPDELLPAGWPRARARAVFTELDEACARWRCNGCGSSLDPATSSPRDRVVERRMLAPDGRGRSHGPYSQEMPAVKARDRPSRIDS